MRSVLRTKNFEGIPTVKLAEAERILVTELRRRAMEALNDQKENIPHHSQGSETLHGWDDKETN